MRTTIQLATVAALVLALSGCGGDDEPTKSTPNSSPTSTTSTPPSSSDSASPNDEPATVTECATPEQVADFSVNGQLVSQFAKLPTSKWSTTIGKLTELEAEVSALSGLTGVEVEKALAIYVQVPPIIEAGLGGDASAMERLAALVGTDLVESLKLKNTIVLAYGEQCQGAG